MRRRGWFLFPLISALFCLSVFSLAQNWSGILSPSRATDWSGVGAIIANRTTQCGSTISAYAGNANTINNAIAACPSGQFVELGAGTFTLSTGILLNKDNVTLRGQGAAQTKVFINGSAAVSCHIGDDRSFNMCKGGGNIGVDSPDNTAAWSAGYAQGTTVITLSGHANMIVGSTLWLDQLDSPASTCLASEGYPGAGDTCYTNWKSANIYARNNRGLVEGHIVTACGTNVPGASCTSNTITIDPPLMHPVFRSSQTPGAWWGNTSSVLVGVGLENLSLDYTGNGNGLYLINCTNCWIKGVRTVYRGSVSSTWRGIMFINAMNVTVADNYFYGAQATGLISMYGIAPHMTSHSLFQNNIIQASANPFVINSPTYGNVFAYNLFDNAGVNPNFSQPSFILHGAAGMNLFEGNNGRNFSADNIHGSHNFTTLFRNHWDGTARNPSNTETQGGAELYAAQRFFNVIGNVFGANDWTVYENGQPPTNNDCGNAVYCWGWRGTSSTSGATGDDRNVDRTAMRWGNWDRITSTNDTGTNDASGTRFVSGEVPSGITNFSNALPASQSLRASFYLSSKPSWFGSSPWPAIGPDVAGGNAPNNGTTPTGGHANLIPARVCFNSLANDPAYSASPSIKLFDPAACYGSGGGGPDPPTGLQAQPK